MTKAKLTPDEVITRMGGHKMATETLALKPSTTRQWVHQGLIPPAQAISIEVAMKGKIRAVNIQTERRSDDDGNNKSG